MSMIRRLAMALLQRATRHSAAECREWAEAMLRELDFIESDWAALLWALGGTTAIFRRSWRSRWWTRSRSKEGRVNQGGKTAIGLISGVGIAVAVAAVIIAIRVMAFQYVPDLEAGRVPWRLIFLIFVLPETIFIVSTVALWRKRRPMAVGILISALALSAHLAMHFVSNWRG